MDISVSVPGTSGISSLQGNTSGNILMGGMSITGILGTAGDGKSSTNQRDRQQKDSARDDEMNDGKDDNENTGASVSKHREIATTLKRYASVSGFDKMKQRCIQFVFGYYRPKKKKYNYGKWIMIIFYTIFSLIREVKELS